MADSSNNKTFKSDDKPTDTELIIDASLDLTNQPGGMLYFNQENNYKYTQNWYNYGKLHNVGDETIINEVVSYASPTLVPNTLDTTKTYTLPSTSLDASWAGRIEVSGSNSAGFSGVDTSGNVYILTNYSGSSISYNANGTSAVTKSSPGGTRALLTKYDSSGTVQWASRITCPNSAQSVTAQSMATGPSGTTYIIGKCTDTSIQFENSSGTVILTTPLKQYTFLAAYSSAGVPLWATYFGPMSYPSISVHEPTYSVYMAGFPISVENLFPDSPQLFYSNLPSPLNPSAPGTPIFSLGRYAAYGTSVLTTVARSAGGVSTLTFSSNVTNLGLYVGTKFSLLGLNNDSGSFNTSSGVFTITTTTTNTISYSNATGTMPLVSTASTGTPILAIYEPNAAMSIIRMNSTNGSFSWATYVDGYTLGPGYLISGTQLNAPYITTDNVGNVFASTSYFYIRNFKTAATPTQPLITDSTVKTPPLAFDSEIKVYGEDRNWVDITCEDSGSTFVALDRGGYIYLGLDYGTRWIAAAFEAEWNCVTWVTTQWESPGYYLIVAGVYNGLLYYSNNLSDLENTTWNVCGGEGTVARRWVALSGSSNETAIALAENEVIYYSKNGGVTWLPSTSPVANWIDVAWTNTDPSDPYDPDTGYWVALIKNGQAYRSTDGITWTLIAGSPSVNWKAIAGFNNGYKNIPTPNYFYAVVENGPIYAITSSFEFRIVDYNIRKYSDISIRGGGWTEVIMVACVDGGSVYVSREFAANTYNTTWVPITIPGDWSSIKLDEVDSDIHFAVTDKGGKIYVMKPFAFYSQSVLYKYNISGIPQWSAYILSPDSTINFSSNHALTIATQPNGNVLLHGWAGTAQVVPIYFYSSQDFDHPVKIQTYDFFNVPYQFTQCYLVCYSNDGIPLWNNKINLENIFFNSISTDSLGNIYCVGTTNLIRLYNPDDQLAYSDSSGNSAVLVKYYPNGYVQSFTRFVSSSPSGISVNAVDSDVYVSGRYIGYSGSSIQFRNSPGTVTGITESITAYPGVYIVKYSSGVGTPIIFPVVPYNNTFDPTFTIGGSTQLLILGSAGYGDIEKWGGQTGLPPSTMTLADINTGTICYLGHEPGYSIPLEYGLQTTSPINYRYLSVLLGEPTFPENDPQPVTYGTIPYGYLAINILYPNYASALQFNNTLNNGTNLILSATGTITGSGLVPTGVSPGDVIRVMIYSPTVDRFVNLTVKDMVSSSTSPVIYAGIRFEENTRFLCSVLGTTTTATTTLLYAGNLRYLPAYYAPSLFQSGSINVVMQMYPKQQL